MGSACCTTRKTLPGRYASDPPASREGEAKLHDLQREGEKIVQDDLRRREPQMRMSLRGYPIAVGKVNC